MAHDRTNQHCIKVLWYIPNLTPSKGQCPRCIFGLGNLHDLRSTKFHSENELRKNKITLLVFSLRFQ